MDKNSYIQNLKTVELRPKKIKVSESEPQILLEQDNDMGDVHNRIVNLFKANPNPKEPMIRKWAKEMEMSEDEFEEHIYMVMTRLLKTEHISELFIQQGEIEAMDKGPQKDVVMLRLSMIAELDAANLYERFAELTSNSNIRKVMLDVAHEEKVHSGEFETLVEKLDKSYKKAEEEGKKEIENMKGT